MVLREIQKEPVVAVSCWLLIAVRLSGSSFPNYYFSILLLHIDIYVNVV